MRLSVVIASKDRPELLRRVVEELREQVADIDSDAEIVVVDDGSQPPYNLGDMPEVRVLRTSGHGPARARNEGVRASAGDITIGSAVCVLSNVMASAIAMPSA